MSDLSNVIIGTTATNRSVLHTDVLPDWLKWITKLENAKFTWFVNIDMIEGLPDTYEKTQSNIENILEKLELEEIVDVKFLAAPGNGKGNFLNACKRIAKNIVSHVSAKKIDPAITKVIWLEDDWKFNPAIHKQININDVVKTFSTPNSHINLTLIRNNYIWALAPSIIGYKLWASLFAKAWIVQKDNVDPEHCVGKFYIKHFGKEKHVHNLTVIYRPEKKNYLKRKYINYPSSRFTVMDEKVNVKLMDHNRFILKNKFIKQFSRKMFFVRITPTFCIGGCKYGRDFMAKYNLEKARKQNNEVTDFYK